MLTSINAWKNNKTMFKMHESKEYYGSTDYISDVSITSIDMLKSKIESDVNAAFSIFAQQLNLPIESPNITIYDGYNNRAYLNLDVPIASENLGIFANIFSECKLNFSSGAQVVYAIQDDEFIFNPYIWAKLNVSYKSKFGNMEDIDYPVCKLNNAYSSYVYYDIIEGKFMTNKLEK